MRKAKDIGAALAPIPAAIDAFVKLVSDLEAAGVPIDLVTTTLVDGVVYRSEYLGGRHVLKCYLLVGSELLRQSPKGPTAKFVLYARGVEKEVGSVSGEFDPIRRSWTGCVRASVGDVPDWLQPFLTISREVASQDDANGALLYQRIVARIAKLFSDDPSWRPPKPAACAATG